MKHTRAVFLLLVPVVFLYSGCVTEGNEEVSVTYHLNNGYGDAPVDATAYSPGSEVVVLPVPADAAAPLGTTFYGWSTARDGRGAFYKPGAAFVINKHTILYALWTGDGTNANYPKLASTKDELLTIGTHDNFALAADIDNMDTVLFTQNTPFFGTFDGRGHTITLNIDKSGSETTKRVGLFAYNTSPSVIKNLNVTGTITVSVTAADSALLEIAVGGIAAAIENTAAIKNCRSSVNITVTSDISYISVGGLIGAGYGKPTVEYCYYSGQLKSTYTGSANDYHHFISGITTYNAQGTMTHTVSEAGITWTNDNVGYAVAKGDARGIMRFTASTTSNVVLTDNYALGTVAMTDNLGTVTTQAANEDYDGAAVSALQIGSEVWWRYTAGWDDVWGGDRPTVDKPWTWDAAAKRPKLAAF